jgi:hypothetical protein
MIRLPLKRLLRLLVKIQGLVVVEAQQKVDLSNGRGFLQIIFLGGGLRCLKSASAFKTDIACILRISRAFVANNILVARCRSALFGGLHLRNVWISLHFSNYYNEGRLKK